MENRTEGVDTILGDPRKAIRRMTVPMLVAMTSQTLYNLIDAIWVAGLGSDALAAVGLVFPIFFILNGIGNGLGVGAASAIARRVGAGDKEGADSVAAQALVLSILATLILTLPLVLLAEDIFTAMGAGTATPLCVEYAQVIFAGTGVIFVVTLLDSILRAEGDAKRSMRMMIIASALNIVLDPIFIYTLGLGVGGAALASVLAFGIAGLVQGYWFFVKKDTFVRFHFQGFRFRPREIWDILRVGIPASLEMTILSISSLVMNMIILSIDSTDGVAIYSSGWRVFQMAMIPFFSIGAAMIPVCGAAYGGRRYDKLQDGYRYGIALTVGIMAVFSVVLALFAPWITMLFTYSEGTAHLQDGMVLFVRIGCIFLPFIGAAAISTMMFQAIGKGLRAMVSTLIRNVLFLLPPVYFLGQSYGIIGVWWGMVLGEVAGALLILTWALFTLRVLMKEAPLVRAPEDGPA